MKFDKNGNLKVVTDCRPIVRWCELEKEMSEEEKEENRELDLKTESLFTNFKKYI